MKFFRDIILFTVSACSLMSTTQAQVEVSNRSDFESLKDHTTTYLLVNHADAERAVPYINALKEHWKLTKLEVLDLATSDFVPNPEDTYLSVSWTMKVSSDNVITHMYLDFYALEESAFEKESNKVSVKDHRTFFRMELHPVFNVAMDPTVTDRMDFSYADKFRNWTPGLLAAYARLAESTLSSGQPSSRFSDHKSRDLGKLATSRLYIPEYTLVKFNPFSGDETGKHKPDKLMKKYPHPYEVVSMSRLDELLLNPEEDVFCFVYVKSSTDKHMMVFNAQTGEMLYTEYRPISYNVKDSDFKYIASLVSEYASGSLGP